MWFFKSQKGTGYEFMWLIYLWEGVNMRFTWFDFYDYSNYLDFISPDNAHPPPMYAQNYLVYGGVWLGIISEWNGYDFDVCARLENSISTPSTIFL